MYASPAVVAGGGVFALLYGMVLFAVLSSQRQNPVEAYEEPPPLAWTPREPGSTVATWSGKQQPPETKSAPPVTSSPAVAKNASTTSEAKPAPPPASVTPNTPPPPPCDGIDSAALTPAPPSAQVTTKPNASDPPAVALNSTTPKVAGPTAIPVLEGPTFAGLSPWLDPSQSAKPKRDGDAIVLAVPAGIHILSPEMKHKDAPMSLTEVSGDFEVQVRFRRHPARFLKPLPDVPLPGRARFQERGGS